jgi:hypothetical protein
MSIRHTRIGYRSRRYVASVAGLAVAVAVASLTHGDEKPDKQVPEKVRKLLEGKDGARRVNGVRLKAEVEMPQQVLSGDEPPSEYLRKRLEGAREAAKRVNGVQLKLAAEVRESKRGTIPGDTHEILLHWTIDYNGPRPPLTILRPSLDAPIGAQCGVIFYPVAPDGKEYPVPFLAPVSDTPVDLQKEDFLRLKPGEVGRGTLIINALTLRAITHDRWPKQFAKGGAKPLYVQLRHAPMERGEGYGLDAWTGSLQSDWVSVPLEKLKLD